MISALLRRSASGIQVVARAAGAVAEARRVAARTFATGTGTALMDEPRFPQWEQGHDVGGAQALFGSLDTEEAVEAAHWERQLHALLGLLVAKEHMNVDRLRRGVESLDPALYGDLSYYEKWAVAMSSAMVEAGVLPADAIDSFVNHVDDGPLTDDGRAVVACYEPGDVVRVLSERRRIAWGKPHLRTPGYVHGAVGEVVALRGAFGNPELLAYGRSGPMQPLYTVRFLQGSLWWEYRGNWRDTCDVEVFQPWLEAADEAGTLEAERGRVKAQIEALSREPEREHTSEAHSHHHQGEPHVHESRDVVECNANAKETFFPYQPLAEALVHLLVTDPERTHTIATPDELRAAVDRVDTANSRMKGPRIVARAWTDPAFKARLLEDGNAACAEMGISASNYASKTGATHLCVVENTPHLHHLVVCTLCSCYFTAGMGLSPAWYKSRAYRARAVREPRVLLEEEFGVRLPDHVEMRVCDSTADLRYMVLPQRPEGTQGWSEDALARLVTRDALIGVLRDLPVPQSP